MITDNREGIVDHEELVSRVEYIREDLDRHKGQCAVQAHLRAQLDRDLADTQQRVKAIHTTVQALATTQSEHTKTLGEHTNTLGEHTLALGRLEAGQKKLEIGQEKLEVGQKKLEAGQKRLEAGQKTILNLLERLTPQA